MRLVNTRILRHFWSKSVENHQCYRRKTLKNVKNRLFFDFLRPPRSKIKNWAPSLHAVCAIFEVNQLRNTSFIGEKPSKTSKIGCYSNFHGPLTPPKSYRPRSYMQLINTRILRHFLSKSVEKHQCYSWKTLKNVKNRVFSHFDGPPDPKSKIGLR